MLLWLLRRLLLMVPTTLGILLVVFGLFHLAPGDPISAMAGAGGGLPSDGADLRARIRKLEERHGFDRALPVQFLNYLGPFNLLRNGHPWFSSPAGERELERVPLAGGGVALEGEPVPIPPLARTPPAERARLAGAAGELLAAEEPARIEAATATLAAAGPEALPFLLDALATASARGEAARVERLSRALAAAGGQRPAPPAERVAELGAERALTRHWFGWYYAGPGARVRNSGERPWGGLLTGDLGRELVRRTPVAEELWRRLKVTVPLALVAALLGYAIALPLGIFSARRQGSRLDAAATVVLFLLHSIPTFWAGLLLILLFGATGPDWWWWPRLPVLGLHDKDAASMGGLERLWDLVLHSILPVATLAYGSLAYLSRQMRAGMLDVLRQDYVRTARAKGLGERAVIYKHALRNSLIPVITVFATVLPSLVGGSILVEMVFEIPGMGLYAYQGLLRRDFYVVMAVPILVGLLTQVGILVSDVAYALVDPRIRHD